MVFEERPRRHFILLCHPAVLTTSEAGLREYVSDIDYAIDHDVLPCRLPRKHSTVVDGVIHTSVSVSTLLEPIAPSFVPYFVQEAALRGTEIHKKLEAALRDEDFRNTVSSDEQTNSLLKAIKEVIAIEESKGSVFVSITPEHSMIAVFRDQLTDHSLGAAKVFGGTADALLVFKDKASGGLYPVIVDLKTTTEVKTSHMYQTFVYLKMAIHSLKIATRSLPFCALVLDSLPALETYGIYLKEDNTFHIERWVYSDETTVMFLHNSLDYIYNPLPVDNYSAQQLIARYAVILEHEESIKPYIDFIEKEKAEVLEKARTLIDYEAPSVPISLKFPLTEDADFYITTFHRETLKKAIVDSYKEQIKAGALAKEDAFDVSLSKREGIRLLKKA